MSCGVMTILYIGPICQLPDVGRIGVKLLAYISKAGCFHFRDSLNGKYGYVSMSNNIKLYRFPKKRNLLLCNIISTSASSNEARERLSRPRS